MKGLILTYLITAFGAIGALRYPLIGLYVFAGFAIVRPQIIFAFAGDIRYISLVIGIALLFGWAVKGFGSWRMGRARPIVIAFLLFVTWFVLAAFLALDTETSYLAAQEFAKLSQVLVAATFDKFSKVHRGPSGAKSPFEVCLRKT